MICAFWTLKRHCTIKITFHITTDYYFSQHPLTGHPNCAFSFMQFDKANEQKTVLLC